MRDLARMNLDLWCGRRDLHTYLLVIIFNPCVYFVVLINGNQDKMQKRFQTLSGLQEEIIRLIITINHVHEYSRYLLKY